MDASESAKRGWYWRSLRKGLLARAEKTGNNGSQRKNLQGAPDDTRNYASRVGADVEFVGKRRKKTPNFGRGDALPLGKRRKSAG